MPPEISLDRFAPDGAVETGYRFPIINTAYPRWCYVTAVVVGELWDGQPPNEAELRMVASFHDEYVERWYRESYKAELRRKYPFDVDGGANGRYLIKRTNGGWAFRRASWQYGPMFVPGLNDPPRQLVQVLDREQSFGSSKPNPAWEQWKTNHPDVFTDGTLTNGGSV